MIELMVFIVILLAIITACVVSIVVNMDKKPQRTSDADLRVQLAAAQGAVCQLQTCLSYSVNVDPAKVLHTVLAMYGVNIDVRHIPEQVIDAAAKGDYEELTILLKVFYGIEIKGVKA